MRFECNYGHGFHSDEETPTCPVCESEYTQCVEWGTEYTKHGFTRQDWLSQNGLYPSCECPETVTKYHSCESGKLLECARCGKILGRPNLS